MLGRQKLQRLPFSDRTSCSLDCISFPHRCQDLVRLHQHADRSAREFHLKIIAKKPPLRDRIAYKSVKQQD
jgi:hypothetical protein